MIGLIGGCTATREWDVRVGDETSQEMEAAFGLVGDHAARTYVEQLGQRLVRQLPDQKFAYKFEVLDEPTPNAFALPGGHVYVTRGLLALVNSEDELANVIAHEIGHVEERHSAQRHGAATVPMLATLPGSLLGAVVDKDLGNLVSFPFAHAGMAFLTAYSRDQEAQADRFGQTLAARAGFDPAGLTAFLRNGEALRRLEPEDRQVPSHLQTHPGTAERVASTAAFAGSAGHRSRQDNNASRRALLDQIDGIMVGRNPARGIYKDGAFHHLGLGVTIQFPPQWVAVQAAGSVGAMSPTQEAIILCRAPRVGKDPSQAATPTLQVLQRERAIQITRALPGTINGLPSFVASGHGGRSDAPVKVEFAWVAHDGLIYPMAGITSSQPGHDLSAEIRESQSSFMTISDEDRRNFTLERLRTVPAAEGESLAELSTRVSNRWDAQTLAAMNGVAAGARLEAGQLIKVSVEEPYRAASGQ